MAKDIFSICKQTTSEFYKAVGESFSATRENPWRGWEHFLELSDLNLNSKNLEVSDFACGNMRFEQFLIDKRIPVSKFYLFDNCDKLLKLEQFEVSASFKYTSVDLLDENSLKSLHVKKSDLTVSFGFFHHIPSFAYRKKFLDKLIDTTRCDGYIVISFWQFLNSLKIEAKAKEITRIACNKLDITLEDKNDFFLSWQDRKDIFRYCHNFEDEEIEALVSGYHDVTLKYSYMADGKNGNLNRYIVLQKN